MADSLQAFEAEQDLADFLPDATDDLYHNTSNSAVQAQQPPVPLRTDAVLKALMSPNGGDAPKGFPRYSEKATKYAGNPRSPRGGAAPRFIHQPRG